MGKNMEGLGEALRAESEQLRDLDRKLTIQNRQDFRNTIIFGFALIAIIIGMAFYVLLTK